MMHCCLHSSQDRQPFNDLFQDNLGKSAPER